MSNLIISFLRKHALIIFFLVAFIFTVLKYAPFIQAQRLLDFATDTQRHLYLVQEIDHFDALPRSPLRFLVPYPSKHEMGQIGFYVPGFHLLHVIINDLTGLDYVLVANIFFVFFILLSLGAAYLTAFYFTQNKRASLLTCSIALLANAFIVSSGHMLAAYVLLPLLFGLVYRYEKQPTVQQLIGIGVIFAGTTLIHSNYAFLFVVLCTGYFLWQFFFYTHCKRIINCVVLLTSSLWLTIFALYSFHFSGVFSNPAFSFFHLFGEFTGIWSLDVRPLFIFFLGLFVAALVLCLCDTFFTIRHKPLYACRQKNTSHTLSHRDVMRIFAISGGIAIVLILLRPFIIGFITEYATPAAIFLKLDSFLFSFLLLIFVVSFTKTLYIVPRLLLMLALPFVAFIFFLVLSSFGFLSDTASYIGYIIQSSIFDLGHVFLFLNLAVLLLVFARSPRSKAIFLSVALMLSISFLSFHRLYRDHSPNIFKNMLSVMRTIHSEHGHDSVVASNFEMPRSFFYIPKGRIIPPSRGAFSSKDESKQISILLKEYSQFQVKNFSIYDYARSHNLDFLILQKKNWIDKLPIHAWQHELKSMPKVDILADVSDVAVYAFGE